MSWYKRFMAEVELLIEQKSGQWCIVEGEVDNRLLLWRGNGLCWSIVRGERVDAYAQVETLFQALCVLQYLKCRILDSLYPSTLTEAVSRGAELPQFTLYCPDKTVQDPSFLKLHSLAIKLQDGTA